MSSLFAQTPVWNQPSRKAPRLTPLTFHDYYQTLDARLAARLGSPRMLQAFHEWRRLDRWCVSFELFELYLETRLARFTSWDHLRLVSDDCIDSIRVDEQVREAFTTYGSDTGRGVPQAAGNGAFL